MHVVLIWKIFTNRGEHTDRRNLCEINKAVFNWDLITSAGIDQISVNMERAVLDINQEKVYLKWKTIPWWVMSLKKRHYLEGKTYMVKSVIGYFWNKLAQWWHSHSILQRSITEFQWLLKARQQSLMRESGMSLSRLRRSLQRYQKRGETQDKHSLLYLRLQGRKVWQSPNQSWRDRCWSIQSQMGELLLTWDKRYKEFWLIHEPSLLLWTQNWWTYKDDR